MRSLDDLDGGPDSRDPSESFVQGEKSRIQAFGEGDVRGVLCRDVVSQLPHSAKERLMRVSLYWQIGEIP